MNRKQQKKQQKTERNGSAKVFYTQIWLLKIYLQTAFAAERHLAEGQW
jgi:hypothetical protein